MGCVADTRVRLLLRLSSGQEKTSLVPFDVIAPADTRRSATGALWRCFSEYDGFTIRPPEEDQRLRRPARWQGDFPVSFRSVI